MPVPLPRAIEPIGGIQNQYAPNAYIRLFSCLEGFRRDDLTHALERRTVVQATLMRATIHLVSRQDFWPLALAIRAAQREWWLRVRKPRPAERELEMVARELRALLADGPRPHSELAEIVGRGWGMVGPWLELVRVPPSGTWEQRRAHLFQTAETWVGPESGSPDDVLDHLVRRYLGAFGPAPPTDIATWAGLKARDVAPALRRLRLRRFRDEQGKELVDLTRAPLPDPDTPGPYPIPPDLGRDLARPRTTERHPPREVPFARVQHQDSELVRDVPRARRGSQGSGDSTGVAFSRSRSRPSIEGREGKSQTRRRGLRSCMGDPWVNLPLIPQKRDARRLVEGGSRPYPSTVGSDEVATSMSAHRNRDRGRQAKSRCRDESGNILVLFAIFLPIFMVCCAIVIDVGYWWVNGRKAQIAADACALAAAADLPRTWDDTPNCVVVAGEADYALVNLPEQVTPERGAKHLSTRVRSPYNSDASMVEATVRMRVRTFFGTYVGLDWIDLTRRAVAEKKEGFGDWAIYAHDPFGCEAGNGLEFDNGPGVEIDGRVHSNSRYHVNSGHPPDDDFWAKRGTLDKSICTASLDPEPDGAAYGGGPEPRDFLPEDWVYEPWPAWYTPGQFNWPTCSGANFSARQINIKAGKIELKSPTFGGPDREVNYGGGVIPSGTYCATESLTTSDSGLTGAITLLSPQITIGGTNLHFTPHSRNVLFFSVPNWGSGWTADTVTTNDGSFPTGEPITCTNRDIELVLNAGTVEWAGTIFSPCGRVYLNSALGIGGNPALVGTILGYKVKVNQQDFRMVGKDDFGGNADLALVE